MTNGEAINWIINISADIGKVEHRDLWHYGQALSEIREMLETAQPEHSEGLYVDGFNDGYRERMSDEQHWIPCSERLPENAEEQYWVCTNTGYQCQCRWTDDVYGLGSSGEWAWKIFDIPQYSHVIAWMPLPEPYREEGEHG